MSTAGQSGRRSPGDGSAIVLAHDLLRSPYAKTTHGLIRHGCRWDVASVVDPSCAGEDAGSLLDGRPRGIPVVDSVATALAAALAAATTRPTACIVGVATVGGTLPDPIRAALLDAAAAGLTLVNGLHEQLADNQQIVRAVEANGGAIVDIRRPRRASDLRFWTGEILGLTTPRVAVLGTDCAVGKRTTCRGLMDALRQRDVHAEMIYTGQTGWLQGVQHGFILDATPNDFVPGELERVILECDAETRPDVILLEGQASFCHPAGPCGSEFLLSAGARGVVLQHAPARRFFEGLEAIGCEIPPLAKEIEVIRTLGGDVWALSLNSSGVAAAEMKPICERLSQELGLPASFPLSEGFEGIAAAVEKRLQEAGSP